jgi:hypothetical protein
MGLCGCSGNAKFSVQVVWCSVVVLGKYDVTGTALLTTEFQPGRSCAAIKV